MTQSSTEPSDRLLVRVLGEPCIPCDPTIGGRRLRVLVYLACRDAPAPSGQLLNAVWGGEHRAQTTVRHAVYEARLALRAVGASSAWIVTRQRGIDWVRATEGIVTDLALLRSSYADALHAPPPEALDLLTRGLQLVHGPPFDAPGYDWAHQTGMQTADAALLVEKAATRLVDTALAHGQIDLAREMVVRGLIGLPGIEALYRKRMRAERRAGNTVGVHTAYAELLDFLDSLGIDAQPDAETTALYKSLMQQSQGRAA